MFAIHQYVLVQNISRNIFSSIKSALLKISLWRSSWSTLTSEAAKGFKWFSDYYYSCESNPRLELSNFFSSLWSTCGLWCVSVRRLGIRLFDFCSGQAVVRCKRRWRWLLTVNNTAPVRNPSDLPYPNHFHNCTSRKNWFLCLPVILWITFMAGS